MSRPAMRWAAWTARIAREMRRRRFEHFRSLVSLLSPPVRILDVGGSEDFWRQVGAENWDQVSVTLLNIEPMTTTLARFRSVVGDGRNMPEFGTGEFDVVFSNSVIEHVGGMEDQARMAHEIMRVGKRYYVQTPSPYFPIEPHFFLPPFQFYPHRLKAWVLRRRGATADEADRDARRIRLLNERELRCLFRGARIWREKVVGLTKSLVAYGGWD